MPSKQNHRRQILRAGLGLGLAGLAPLVVQAQEKYPSRPIMLVVPFPPGGSVDLMARQYAEPLSRLLGVPMVVDNRPGAGGSVASLAVARARPDGYTLVVSSQSSHLANPLTQPKVGYDPLKDFENIAILGRQPNVLVVHSSLPIKSFKEFVDYAKNNPGKLNYGSGGVGSMGQLNVEMLKSVAGVYATHIPYRGGTQLITAVLANEVQFILDNLLIMLPHIQSGKVRALAVAADERMPQLPDVPTMAEVGYPQLNLTSWTGLAAPGGTPDAIVQTLYKAVRQAATAPAMVANLKERGVIVPEEMPPAAFKKMMADRMVRFGEVVRKAGITAE
ncbi:Bug family tripartite tricarboxylate transporter substrate binding protein [Xylophilus ampelinus]|uniref:Tripartite-type tricarboxylate transporter receptor subunit TctC n=1 Tax=Xylophilus ampelinus TaxID=54067 RepID=A0A318SJ47_9BURK|nr:tripartite tricarboxylate transporter substrate binding protein [Xylophilus ampelinus]MCS4509610.1 tripartite tricarboxylate transporter substrate binding protein [Xylophilus ampelinus]PYE78906.1 tripartite-type tricarboxylate transporter receptor subunit TctC [Xylophilus ampelinus]